MLIETIHPENPRTTESGSLIQLRDDQIRHGIRVKLKLDYGADPLSVDPCIELDARNDEFLRLLTFAYKRSQNRHAYLDIEYLGAFEKWKFTGQDMSGAVPRSYNRSVLRSRDRDRILAVTIARLCYGGLHLSAWAAPFTTHAEELLWRISAVFLVGSGPMLFIHRTYLEPLRHRLIIKRMVATSFLGKILLGTINKLLVFKTLKFLCLVFYLFSRVYLILECYFSLPYLPDSAFALPQWSQYVPHIV